METRYHGTNKLEPILETGALLCSALKRNKDCYEQTLSKYEELKNNLGNNFLECSALEERLNVYLGDSLETSKGYTVGNSDVIFEFEIPKNLIDSNRFKETLVPGKVDLKYLKKIHTNGSNLGYVKELLKSKSLGHINVKEI